MAQASFHQINHVAQEMRDSFQITRAELVNMMEMLQDEEYQTDTAPTADYTNPIEEDSITSSESTNSLVEPATQLENFKLL